MAEWDFRHRFYSPKLVKLFGSSSDKDGNPMITFGHWCPACGWIHDFPIYKPFRNGAKWTWTGKSSDLPGFTSSMNISYGPNSQGKTYRCHYHLTDGKLIYCSDCTHGLKGQTVDLPDIPKERFSPGRSVSVEDPTL